ncbi:MAG: choice-of-anchor D domain-containing protein [Terriglobales bacterium]
MTFAAISGRRYLRPWLIWAVCAGQVCLSLVGAGAQQTALQLDHRAGSSAFVKISPESLDFGAQPVGILAPPKTATLSNTGTTALTITDIVTSGIDFAQTNTCGPSLAPGATCSIQITFKPAVTGPRMATLQILDSDPASPQSIVLSGTGQ